MVLSDSDVVCPWLQWHRPAVFIDWLIDFFWLIGLAKLALIRETELDFFLYIIGSILYTFQGAHVNKTGEG